MTDDPERILVLEAGGIGDAVMATPTLAALRARVPHARVTVVRRSAGASRSARSGSAARSRRGSMRRTSSWRSRPTC